MRKAWCRLSPRSRTPRPVQTLAEREKLFIIPFVDEGLGNSAYLVGSQAAKGAVLIDPLRDADRYLRAASRRRLRIAYALDTHLHNDFPFRMPGGASGNGRPDRRERGGESPFRS